MRWVLAIVLVVVAGAVGFLAGWAWERDSGESRDTERARAMLYAQQVAAQCTDGDCEILEVERVAPRLWRVREKHSDSEIFCIAIDLDHFRVASDGDTIHGASEVSCSAG